MQSGNTEDEVLGSWYRTNGALSVHTNNAYFIFPHKKAELPNFWWLAQVYNSQVLQVLNMSQPEKNLVF